MSTALFSSDAENVIHRTLSTPDLGAGTRPGGSLEEIYEIQKTVEFIQEKGAKKVALQFSDDLLVESVSIARKLEDATGVRMYILADTSYGSCCVDEVAAEHVGADILIHYGRACLSPSNRLPVMYVFGQKALNVNLCVESFQNLFPDCKTPVVVFSDVLYQHALGELEARLGQNYPGVVFTKLSRVSDVPSPSEVRRFGRSFSPDPTLWPEAYSFFYVGGEGPTLNNLLLAWPGCPFFSFNPETGEGRKEGLNVNRALMKRFYLIERARDAQVVGIVVGTLGVSDYLSALAHLKDVIHRAGKKSHMLSMGKLNPAKLANFPEVDIFVLVACAENSLLDSSEFYRPIVTPDEMEVACNPAREWGGCCVTEFRELLPGGSAHVPFPDVDPEDADRTDVSLITGELRSIRFSAAEPPGEKAMGTVVVRRNTETTVAELGPAGQGPRVYRYTGHGPRVHRSRSSCLRVLRIAPPKLSSPSDLRDAPRLPPARPPFSIVQLEVIRRIVNTLQVSAFIVMGTRVLRRSAAMERFHELTLYQRRIYRVTEINICLGDIVDKHK
ncbi:PREDICTED: diphthamide biosynthesis protein 2 [Nanorana parkeri]|uniref:diphthamide biosynthesis protein 2 n=1 Tax=Nanorana parkeri TaxID=125878 RepID=UPI000854CDD0|nr:PREDICTED: diphthamide biosynthesis protein 2 [Nanorana parkeri]